MRGVHIYGKGLRAGDKVRWGRVGVLGFWQICNVIFFDWKCRDMWIVASFSVGTPIFVSFLMGL